MRNGTAAEETRDEEPNRHNPSLQKISSEEGTPVEEDSMTPTSSLAVHWI